MSDFKKLSAYVDVPCEWVSAAAPRNDKLDQLKTENAKLRELVRDMFSDMVNMDFALKLQGRTFMVVTRYEPRLRKLGVEVDG